MKRIVVFLCVIVLAIGAFSFTGCVDPDEAMPHYEVPDSMVP